MIRYPAVAGQFYPGTPQALQSTLAALIPAVSAPVTAKAVISPHAGYIYSGAVAGETFARVKIPDEVVILGVNHHGLGPDIAVYASGSWMTPLGEVPIAEELARNILEYAPLATRDEAAHRLEHSLEVQVPFLQYRNPQLAIVPIMLSFIDLNSCLVLAKTLARAIQDQGRPVLLVASTDMTHYENRQVATVKDRAAIERILDLDPEGLYQVVVGNRISMCGVIPTTVTLAAARELGATSAELVRYTDSGEASGDTSQVVGYAGFVIS